MVLDVVHDRVQCLRRKLGVHVQRFERIEKFIAEADKITCKYSVQVRKNLLESYHIEMIDTFWEMKNIFPVSFDKNEFDRLVKRFVDIRFDLEKLFLQKESEHTGLILQAKNEEAPKSDHESTVSKCVQWSSSAYSVDFPQSQPSDRMSQAVLPNTHAESETQTTITGMQPSERQTKAAGCGSDVQTIVDFVLLRRRDVVESFSETFWVNRPEKHREIVKMPRCLWLEGGAAREEHSNILPLIAVEQRQLTHDVVFNPVGANLIVNPLCFQDLRHDFVEESRLAQKEKLFLTSKDTNCIYCLQRCCHTLHAKFVYEKQVATHSKHKTSDHDSNSIAESHFVPHTKKVEQLKILVGRNNSIDSKVGLYSGIYRTLWFNAARNEFSLNLYAKPKVKFKAWWCPLLVYILDSGYSHFV